MVTHNYILLSFLCVYL